MRPEVRFPFSYDPEAYSKIRDGIYHEDPRPWDFLEVLRTNIAPGSLVLDAGCGPITTDKLPELAQIASGIVAFDNAYQSKILATAQDNLFQAGLRDKIDLLYADINPKNGVLPFANESFDAATFMLSPHNSQEAFRVLKSGGVAILERVGEGDKRNIKQEFGSDSNCKPRGYLMEDQNGDLSEKYKEDFLAAGFKQVDAQNGYWTTVYTFEGLLDIIKGARTVRGFDIEKDEEILKRIKIKYGIKNHPDFITTSQHRILLIARKS